MDEKSVWFLSTDKFFVESFYIFLKNDLESLQQSFDNVYVRQKALVPASILNKTNFGVVETEIKGFNDDKKNSNC